MTADYDKVSKALADGADASMLCTTCPWDRLCVTPPTMTADDVKQQVAEAAQKDEQDRDLDGAKGGLPVATLLTTMMLAGRDRTGEMCPVFSLRMRSSEGRRIADSLRALMQTEEG